ncbi:MAG: hypothetical protein ABIG11_03430 [bacterium]
MKEKDSLTITHRDKNPFHKLDAFVQRNIDRGRNRIKEGRKKLGIRNPFNYVGVLLKDRSVAAIHASSRFLVNRIVRDMHLQTSRRIVEFGAAEGVITHKILKGLHSEGFILAIEKNDRLYRGLASIHDSRLMPVHGDMRNFRKIMDEAGLGQVDCVVSGIPFSFFSSKEREKLISDVYSTLVHGGRFVAYQCTPHLIPIMRKKFAELNVEVEIRNIPPHFILTGIKG